MENSERKKGTDVGGRISVQNDTKQSAMLVKKSVSSPIKHSDAKIPMELATKQTATSSRKDSNIIRAAFLEKRVFF